MQWNRTSRFEFVGKSMETETTWSEFPNGGKGIVQQVLVPEKEINPKEQDWESHSQGSD